MSKSPLDRTVSWINKTQGRDKFCKAIQYACRFLKYHAEQRGNKQLALKFNGLFTGMRDARKLFRLFKSVNQFQKFLQILKKKGNQTDRTLELITRAAFFLYWFFDNIAILSTIKFLQKDSKKYNKWGATFWFIALLSTLILTIKKFVNAHSDLQFLKQQSYFSSQEERSKNLNKRRELQNAKSTQLINILKTVGDMVPASQGSQLLPRFLGINANDSQIGIGGFISAVITSYQLYD